MGMKWDVIIKLSRFCSSGFKQQAACVFQALAVNRWTTGCLVRNVRCHFNPRLAANTFTILLLIFVFSLVRWFYEYIFCASIISTGIFILIYEKWCILGQLQFESAHTDAVLCINLSQENPTWMILKIFDTGIESESLNKVKKQRLI